MLSTFFCDDKTSHVSPNVKNFVTICCDEKKLKVHAIHCKGSLSRI